MTKKWMAIIRLIAVTVLILLLVHALNQKRKSESSLSENGQSETWQEQVGISAEQIESTSSQQIEEGMLEGDVAIEHDEYAFEDDLIVPSERATKAGFQAFMLEHAFTQNYTKNGVNYGYANKDYENGVDLQDSAARISGMGNEGYIVWVIKNTFGSCPYEFETPYEVYEKSIKVSVDELQAGDLGLYSDSADDNFYGICVGLEDGEPVFSLMDGSWNIKFPFGTNRLCYLQSEKNEFIGDSAPVKFQYFCRPDLPWIAGADEMNLKGLVSYGQD